MRRESLIRGRRAIAAVLLIGILTISLALLWRFPFTQRVKAVSSSIVISQVYGGGGNSGSTYKNDFIELFNRGATPIDLTGWTVQYNSATATTTWQVTNLNSFTIQPGQYYLVQEAQGAGGTTNLPTPDTTGVIPMSATAAKVALVSNTTALSGGCPSGGGIVDLVGYSSTASCSETSPTATLSNTTAAIRNSNGCTDTDNNSSDFAVGSPIPRNTASATNVCSAAGSLSATGSANPSGPQPSDSTLLTVTVTPATNPASTGITVTGDLTSIGGSATQQFYDDGTHGDVTAGNNVFSFLAQVGANVSTGAKNIPISVMDAQSRTATTNISLTVSSPTCGVERWSVKTGTDPDASQVDLSNPVPVTISQMRSWPAPSPTPPDNARVAPYEKTAWVINATMTLYKKETDVDYHVVVQDRSGNTIVTEIPCPCCVGQTSPFLSFVTNARQKFDARLSATTSFQPATIPVRLKGVGFFDFLHGQTGVAPNGIELHPILDIVFFPAVISISNFDGDSKGDLAVWNPNTGFWYVHNSQTNTDANPVFWGSGALGDIPVPGDYDGDGKTDVAVWRPSEGNWYVVKSTTGTAFARGWGGSGDIPVRGDYDGDGKTDFAVYRPSEGNWYVIKSSDSTVLVKNWGASADVPVPSDYDGDGQTDVAVFRPSEGNWYILNSNGGVTVRGWGTATDKFVPADYDGDGKVDLAVYRPNEGNWYIINSSTNTVIVRGWGTASDKPVPADYDGDGKADIAVWRPSEANWYIIQSSTGTVRVGYLGESGDVPVPSAYLPQ
jgi:hypothetical protein